MDAMVIGIDVSKDRLDVAVRPTGESLIFKRTGVGIEDLIARLGALSPKMVAIEATADTAASAKQIHPCTAAILAARCSRFISARKLAFSGCVYILL